MIIKLVSKPIGLEVFCGSFGNLYTTNFFKVKSIAKKTLTVKVRVDYMIL